ncbi:hypothetical protein VTP01DRAFT_9816 [Rhizomucor pusillus]|uniref:uncharacterized protein n=1 Tax=Rhizomucor pusillus TaxID=4840 RepID=UPI003743E9FE
MKMKYACLPRTELLPSFPSSRFAAAYPLPFEAPTSDNAGSTVDLWTADFWLRFVAILVLVLLGGVFAGLTLGLMGLDQTNLHVMVESGTEDERKNARRVLRLLDRGKHWVLVTLLLSNVIVNETLPIILDSLFGGGWQAILISTALIVIFGEVIPQSVCVRHGLAIGARCSFMVLLLMYAMYPVAYPTALLLDYFLGESHGTVYKKAGLKTLVSLHQVSDSQNGDGLTEDEVLIIGSVLDLRAKPVSQVMTPIDDVFTMSIDDVMDRNTVDRILTAGYSRIPIRAADDKTNFIGMLLVKKLIAYDTADELPVSHFQLSPLPETAPNTSCLDILNFFQEGRSHMALVSNNPGAKGGALGVITLEDVIEELIGEEIVDETDVYVDVHKKVKVVRGKTQPPPPELQPLLHIMRTSSNRQLHNRQQQHHQQQKSQRSSKRGKAADNDVKRNDTPASGDAASTSDSDTGSHIERNMKGYGATSNSLMD